MVLVPHGIRMPGGRMVDEREPLRRRSAAAALCAEAGQRGLVGRRRDRHRRTAITAIRSAATSRGRGSDFEQLLAEPFIRGRELTVAVLDDEALAVTELRPKSGFYDYDAKYTDGMTEHVCPADIPADIAAAALEMALKAHRLLGCKGASRSDFRWDDEQGEDGLYPARGEHPARHDPAQPGARAGAGARHRLCRAGRADRGGGVMTARIATGRRRRGARARAGAQARGARGGAQARPQACSKALGFAPGTARRIGNWTLAPVDRRGGRRRDPRLPPAAARRARASARGSARPASR